MKQSRAVCIGGDSPDYYRVFLVDERIVMIFWSYQVGWLKTGGLMAGS